MSTSIVGPIIAALLITAIVVSLGLDLMTYISKRKK